MTALAVKTTCCSPEDIAQPLDPEVGRELYGEEAAWAKEHCTEKGCHGFLDECFHESCWLKFGRDYDEVRQDAEFAREMLERTRWWEWDRRRTLRHLIDLEDAITTQLSGLTWVWM